MNGLDWLLAGLVAVSALWGLIKGGIAEAAGVASLILASLASAALWPRTAPLLTFVPFPILAKWLAIAIVFVAVLLVVRIAGGVVARAVRATPLSGVDRLAGLGLGAGRGVLICALFAMIVGALFPLAHPPGWVARSRLFPVAADAGAALGRLARSGKSGSQDGAKSPISLSVQSPPPFPSSSETLKR